MENNLKIVRKKWIDVLRSLAMLFVIYGHLLEKSDYSYIYYVFTSPIKIPLFFAISGYLLNENVNLVTFLRKILRGLVIPWLVLSVVPVFLVSILKGRAYLFSNIKAILSGISFWYMPCCILAEIMFYFVLKICNKKSIPVLGSSVVLSSLGVFFVNTGVLDLLMFNRALSTQLFLTMGYFIKKYDGELDKVKKVHLYIGAGIYVAFGVLSIFLFPGQNLDVHKGDYYNLPICLIMVILGCFLLFEIGKRLDFKNGILSFIGRNTLVYYMLASYPITVYNVLISKVGINLGDTYLSAIIKSIFVCCLCAVFALFINAIIPEAVGKKRKAGN